MSQNFLINLQLEDGEFVPQERHKIKRSNKIYVGSKYPDFIDSEIVKKYCPGDRNQDFYNILLKLGAFPWVFKNFKGFVIPARGNGSCFYNAFAKYLEIYRNDITERFENAASAFNDYGELVLDAYFKWYACKPLTTEMKLRVITAWYILQNAHNYSDTFGSVDEYVVNNVLQPGSLADEPVIVAIHTVLRINIQILSPRLESGYDRNYTVPNSKGTIVLFHLQNAHYDLILSQRQMACVAAIMYGELDRYKTSIVEYFDNRKPEFQHEISEKLLFHGFL